MKFKTTEKEIKANYSKIIKIGYCSLQTLLNCKTPVAYTSGKYGWKSDIYDINGIAISTGYAPCGNIEPEYDMVQRYELKAQEIYYSVYEKYDYQEVKNQLEKLLNDFIMEVTQ